MITVAIGIVVIAALILSIFILYDTERSRVMDVEHDARQQDDQKINENIEAVRVGNNVTITNEWNEETKITGLLVVCDNANGTRLTMACGADSAGTITCGPSGVSVGDAIADMEASCPP